MSVAILAGVLQALGMLPRLADLADSAEDPKGLRSAGNRCASGPHRRARGVTRMSNVEVFLDWRRRNHRVGLLRRHASRGRETVTFEYAPEWLAADDRFSMDPALPVGPGLFRPPAGAEMFGTLGDSAPDTWGRMLMRRRERRAAEREGRAVRTLHETDFLLGVSDQTRLGALRFRWEGDEVFQAPQSRGVPDLLALGDLLGASQRIVRGDETDEDLRMIFAPGSSLGAPAPRRP